MAEFLVRVVDRVNTDPYLDCQCLKSGDVVCIVEDGHVWSLEEQTNPHWRIVQAPNISQEQAQNFLKPETDVDPLHPSYVLQVRANKLDLSRLPAQWLTWAADSTRAQPKKLFNGTGIQVLNLLAPKVPLTDPNILVP
jgi:hypothetical protein